MKKFILMVVASIAGLGLFAQQGYVVEGHIEGLKDGTIQMKKIYDGKVLDETVAKDGKFVFKKEGKFVGDKVYLTGEGYSSKQPFYLEPGKITINGNTNLIVADGTPSNIAHNKYLEAIAPVEKKIEDIRKGMRTEKDEAKRAKLQEELSHQYTNIFYPTRKAFAKKYNNTILAAEFLSAGTGQLTYADMKELIDGLDPKTPENWYTNRLKNRLEVLRKTDFGQVPPDFTLPDPDGKKVSLSSLKGNIVLVDFWASWCAPCRAENQNVLKLYNKYNKDGFTVISVSIDEDKDKWVKAIQDDKLPWHHVSSLTGWECPVANSLGVAYGMSGVPYTLLLDREGRVIGHNVRGVHLEKKLEELFSKK